MRCNRLPHLIKGTEEASQRLQSELIFELLVVLLTHRPRIIHVLELSEIGEEVDVDKLLF